MSSPPKTMKWLQLIIFCIAIELNQLPEIWAIDKNKTNEANAVSNLPSSKCNPDEYEFRNHCYFIKELNISGEWNINDIKTYCRNHKFRSNNISRSENSCDLTQLAKGMAVESPEELDFIKDKLMFINGDDWKALTSGYWACWPKHNLENTTYCGTWHDWNSVINNAVFGFASCRYLGLNDFCEPQENIFVYFVLRKEYAGIIWDVWVPYFSRPEKRTKSFNQIDYFNPPTHIICEYEIQNMSSCTTNGTISMPTITTSMVNETTSAKDESESIGHSSTKEAEEEVADSSATRIANGTDTDTDSTTTSESTTLEECPAITTTSEDTITTTQGTTGTGNDSSHGTSTDQTTPTQSPMTTYSPITLTTDESKTSPIGTTGTGNDSSNGTSTDQTTPAQSPMTTYSPIKLTTDEPKTSPIGTSTTEATCKMCKKKDNYGYLWVACAGEVAYSKCPTGDEEKCSWECDTSGLFLGKTPDYSHCHHDWVNSLVNSNSSATDKANKFQQNTNNGFYFGHEILDILGGLENVTNQFKKEHYESSTADSVEQICKSFISTMGSTTDNLIKDNYKWDEISEEDQAKAGVKLQDFLHKLGVAISSLLVQNQAENVANFEFPFSSIYIGVDLSRPSKNSKLSFPVEGPKANGSITVFGANNEPENNFMIAGTGNIIPSNHGKQIFPETFKSWTYTKAILNTAVISYSYDIVPTKSSRHGYPELRHKSKSLIIHSVEVELPHSVRARGPESETIRRALHDREEITAVLGSSKCVFWNMSIGLSGEWDGTGCKVESTNETHTKCICTHLSSFAVFMSLHEYKDKGFIMDLLTWICSGSSILSLTITLVIFNAFRHKLSGERETICKNTSACLLLTHILTLSVLDKTYFNLPDPLCSFVGAVLHYTLSASIMWMAAEGHYLYWSILLVMDASGKDRRNLYRVLCYGVPAIFVAVTALIGLALGENAYGNPEICWLSLHNYQWVFIIQALLMTGANTLVLILALRVTVSATTIRDKSTQKKIWIWIRGWFTLSSLLGVSWFIGLLSFDSSIYLEYMFVVFNGSQGVLIFITRVIRNRQIKKIISNMIRNHKLIRGTRFKANLVTGSSTYADGSTKSTKTSHALGDQLSSSANEITDPFSPSFPQDKEESGEIKICTANNLKSVMTQKHEPGYLHKKNSQARESAGQKYEENLGKSIVNDESKTQHGPEDVTSNHCYRIESLKVTYSRKEERNGAPGSEFLTELKARLMEYRKRMSTTEQNSLSGWK